MTAFHPSRSPGALLVALGITFTAALAGRPAGPAVTAQAPGPRAVAAGYGRLPLSFEPNRGQTAAPVRFLARGRGATLFLTPTEAVLTLRGSGVGGRETGDGRPGTPLATGAPVPGPRSSVVRMQMDGANPRPRMEGLGRLPGAVNYFRGSDPARWHSRIPTYGQVAYRGVYPGVDLVYYGREGQVEYDFVVAPGADPSQIRLSYIGAERLALDPAGDLLLNTPAGEVRQHRPVVYQVINGQRVAVDGSYVLKNEGGRMKDEPSGTGTLHPSSLILHPSEVAFNLGAYDRTRPLIIDPVLSYSTYLGGSDDEQGYGIAVDSTGAAYIAGRTKSTNFPTANPSQAQSGGDWDAFVVKLNPAGTQLVYATYLGGNKADMSAFSRMGIAIDSAGSAYVSGFTDSDNFPTTPGAFDNQAHGFGETFVTKLSPDGGSLAYSTRLGGDVWDYGHSITVDAGGNAIIAGGTGSRTFPLTTGAIQTTNAGGLTDVYVTKLNATGTQLIYSTILGGAGNDDAQGVAVDGNGLIYITGSTSSDNFPVTAGAFQTASGGGSDAFVAKINPAAAGNAALVYSTYLGGAAGDNGFLAGALAIDSGGNAYVTGVTGSDNFPLQNPIISTRVGTGDGFVTKVNPTGSGLVYSTFLGAGGFTVGNGIAVDADGNAYVTGVAGGDQLPLVGAFQNYGGANDAFITKINPAGSALVYSSYYGGAGGENTVFSGYGAIALDSLKNAYITGTTTSDNLPTVTPLQPANAGLADAFVAKIVPAPPAAPTNLEGVPIGIDRVSLTWIPGTGGDAADSFELERRQSNGTYALIATLPASTTQYLDTGRQAGQTYLYRLRAVNGGGPSGYSNEVTVQMPTVPAAPSNLVATAVSTRQINLSWKDNSSNEVSFQIERKVRPVSGPSFFDLIGEVGPNVTTYEDKSVTSGTTYVYRVRSVNAGGGFAYSNEATASTQGPNGTPSNLRVSVPSSTSLRLTWLDNSTNEIGFKIERRGPGEPYHVIVFTGPNTTSYLDTGRAPNTTYTYRVIAANQAGDSAPSNEASGRTSPPPAPQNFVARALSSTRIQLTWSDVASAGGYRLERKSGGVAFRVVRTLAAGTRTVTDTGLEAGTTYTYRLQAFNGAGASPYSAEASATTVPPPAAPTALAATSPTSTEVRLSWRDNSSDEQGFEVERSTDGNTFTRIGSTRPNSPTFMDTRVAGGRTFSYRVRAFTVDSRSPYSNVVRITPLKAPEDLTAKGNSSTRVSLSWSPGGTGETGFQVERSTDRGTTFSRIATVRPEAASFQDVGLVAGRAYVYRVRAVGAAGFSSYSNRAETTLLAAPTGLRALSPSSHRVELIWTEGTNGESGFEVERSTDGGASFTEIATTGSGAVRYVDLDVTANRTFHYRVRAFAPGKVSSYSNTARVSVLGPVLNLIARAVSRTQVNLSWADRTTGEQGFRIERSTDGVNFRVVTTVRAGATTFADTGRTPGTRYTYRVQAFAPGSISDYSNTASALTPR